MEYAQQYEGLVIEGLYIGMPVFHGVVLARRKGVTFTPWNIEVHFAGQISKIRLSWHERYAITNLDDETFCRDFREKYGNKMMRSWNFDGYNQNWKSTKYGVKVSFNERNGEFVIETY